MNLAAQGDENAVGFSLAFDPAALSFAGANLGNDAAGATLLVNTNQATLGRLGVVLALPTGTSFTAGNREVLKLNMAALGGSSLISFTNQPVLQETSDVFANALNTGYTNGAVVIRPLTLQISVAGDNIVLAWPLTAADFSLQSIEGGLVSASNWTNVVTTVQTNGGNIEAVLPISRSAEFFRLYHP